MPVSRNPMDLPFEKWLSYVHGLPYFERRLKIAQVQPRLNRFLYKYKAINPSSNKSIDHVRDILVRSRLWLSSPVDFNDPFDMSARIVANATGRERRERYNSLLKEQGIKYKKREQIVSNLAMKPIAEIEKELEATYRNNLEEIGVFSFAGTPRSILMWSHYARDHTGICFQFEAARDFSTLSRALQVEYSSEYPEINWVNRFPDSLGKVMLRKHEGWSYEREQRIVRVGDAHKYLEFDPRALVGIILGCRITTDSRGAIAELLEERRRANMPPIRQYFALQHKSRYKLSVMVDR